jgi:hypothetical protein
MKARIRIDRILKGRLYGLKREFVITIAVIAVTINVNAPPHYQTRNIKHSSGRSGTSEFGGIKWL